MRQKAFAFHLSNEGQAFGKAKYLEAVEEVLDQIGSLTGRTNKRATDFCPKGGRGD